MLRIGVAATMRGFASLTRPTARSVVGGPSRFAGSEPKPGTGLAARWFTARPKLCARLRSGSSAQSLGAAAVPTRRRDGWQVRAMAPPMEDLASSVSLSNPTFESLGLAPELVAAVEALGLETPTEIQSKGIPEVLIGGDVLLASQTGSGKTLSYLLPLIHRLRLEEQETDFVTRPKRPRAIVLLPTRELAHQILSVAKSLSHHARFRSTVITGGDKYSLQKAALGRAQDIIVATPGRLLQHVDDGNVTLGDLKYLVLDEADTLFDSGFTADIKRLLRPMRRQADKQCIMVAATMSKPVRALIAEDLPEMRDIESSSLHKAAQNCKHDFVRVPGDSNKLDYLRQAIDGDVKRGKQTMIFCNTVQSCRAVEHSLSEHDIPSLSYHGDMPKEARSDSFAEFLAHAPEGQKRAVLVCTDLAARGLDVGLGGVDHVVNFDFPKNPVDYVHRTGRTARAGADGRVTSLVGKRDETIAYELHQQIINGGQLAGVATNKRELTLQRKKAYYANQEAAKKKAFKESRKLGRGGRTAVVVKGAAGKSGKPYKGKLKGGASADSERDGKGRRTPKAKAVDTTRRKYSQR